MNERMAAATRRGVYLRRLAGTTAIPGGVRAEVDLVRFADVGDERRPVITSDEPLRDQTIFTNVPNAPRDAGDAAPHPAAGQLTLEIVALAAGVTRVRLGTPEWLAAPRDFGMLAGPLPEPLADAAPPDLAADPFAVALGPVQTPLDDRDVHGLLCTPPPGLVETPHGPAALWSWALTPDERLYGLGERFTPIDQRGQRLTLLNTDAWGTTTACSYKYIPFLHSSAGYGLFFHTPAPVTLDLGATSLRAATAQVGEPGLDLFVIQGANPAAILERYTALTGRATMPPRWAFGVWLSRCRYQTRAEVEAVAARARQEGVPCDVLHIDPAWLDQPGLNCDFISSDEHFPDLPGMVRELGAQGFKVCLWELPYVTSASPRYAAAAANGYFLKDAQGAVIAANFSGPAPDGRLRAVVDFTNPAATAWWQDLHRPYLRAGVAAFKTDFGEGVPLDAVAHNGLTGRELRNLYPLLYNAAVHAVITEETGRPGMVWGRSGWAGTQRYPAQWGGDPKTDAWSMRASLRGGLNLALSAPGIWAHDIGGFYGPPPSPDLYRRWAAFGLLSPLARAHGTTPREPWEFGPDALAAFKRFARLRVRLNPYLYNAAWAAHTQGLPMLRPLALAFPDDPVAATIDDQFLLGPDLLVAPLFSDAPGTVRRRVYLPEIVSRGAGERGESWFRFESRADGAVATFNDSDYDGWNLMEFEDLGLFMRRDAIIPLAPAADHVGDALPDQITLLVGTPGDAALQTAIVWDATGAATHISLAPLDRYGHRFELTIAGDRAIDWRWQVAGNFQAAERSVGRFASGKVELAW